MNKQILLGMLKSKTINVNVILTALLVSYGASHGLPIDSGTAMAIVASAYGLINVILRFLTNKSLPEKGVNIPNPIYVEEFTKAIAKDNKAMKELVSSITKDDDTIKELHSALAEWIKKEKSKKQTGG